MRPPRSQPRKTAPGLVPRLGLDPHGGGVWGCSALHPPRPAGPAASPAAPASPGPPAAANRPAAEPGRSFRAPDKPGPIGGRPGASWPSGLSRRWPAASPSATRPAARRMREVGKDDLVELRDDARHWSLIVSRQTYPQPMNLVAARDGKGVVQPGILEQTAAAVTKQYGDPELLKKGLPGLKMLRQDLTNLGKYDVGMLAYRYTKDTVRCFAQRAIIQANDQVYYLVALTTPARTEHGDPASTPDGEEATEDPGERQAVETFRAILESVRLLDRKAIHDDQVERLFRTRTLMQNWTEKKLAVDHPPRAVHARAEGGQGRASGPTSAGATSSRSPSARATRTASASASTPASARPARSSRTARPRARRCEAWMSVSAGPQARGLVRPDRPQRRLRTHAQEPLAQARRVRHQRPQDQPVPPGQPARRPTSRRTCTRWAPTRTRSSRGSGRGTPTT